MLMTSLRTERTGRSNLEMISWRARASQQLRYVLELSLIIDATNVLFVTVVRIEPNSASPSTTLLAASVNLDEWTPLERNMFNFAAVTVKKKRI